MCPLKYSSILWMISLILFSGYTCEPLVDLYRGSPDFTFTGSSGLSPFEEVLKEEGKRFTKRFQFSEKDWLDNRNGDGVYLQWHIDNAKNDEATFVEAGFVTKYADEILFQGSRDGQTFTTYVTIVSNLDDNLLYKHQKTMIKLDRNKE